MNVNSPKSAIADPITSTFSWKKLQIETSRGNIILTVIDIEPLLWFLLFDAIMDSWIIPARKYSLVPSCSPSISSHMKTCPELSLNEAISIIIFFRLPNSWLFCFFFFCNHRDHEREIQVDLKTKANLSPND